MKLSLCASLLLASATLLSAAPTHVSHIPTKGHTFGLTKNPNYKPDALRSLNKTKAKYAKYLGVATAESVGTVPMTDYENDVEYYGTVTVGTPGQKFKLDFDTGSSDLWFASTLCSSCGSTQTKYNPSASSTYKAEGKTWSISYGDGSTASGITALDTVNLGGLIIKDQRIELAKQESTSFQSDPVDGLLGLAFNSIATVSGTKTPVDNLISQGLISQPIFGVYLGKSSQSGGGEYVFGGYNANHVASSFTTVPVDNSQGFWTIDVDGFSVNSGSTTTPFQGIVDTGTTLLVLADPIAAKIASSLGGRLTNQGLYSISCSNTKTLSFTIGGTKFTIPAADLIFAQQGSTCYSAVAPSGSTDFSILGDTFLKNVYTVFNQQVPEVQFAKVK
ncbi:rhizopuspepsin 6 precursor [Cunninghamella echinulata]|nr:rhizopuspepsin 6 precursor [Cunninghamella echinulata]